MYNVNVFAKHSIFNKSTKNVLYHRLYIIVYKIEVDLIKNEQLNFQQFRYQCKPDFDA